MALWLGYKTCAMFLASTVKGLRSKFLLAYCALANESATQFRPKDPLRGSLVKCYVRKFTMMYRVVFM